MTDSTTNNMTTRFDRKLELLYRQKHDHWADAARDIYESIELAKIIIEEQFSAAHVSPETVLPVMHAILSRARHSHATG